MHSDFILGKGIMQIKLKNAEIQEYVDAPASEFPKYTTQLMNVANQNSHKPSTYDAIPTLAESIKVKMIFYEKKSDGVVFEIPKE